MSELIRIGFWPRDRVTWPEDRSWDVAERDEVVARLLRSSRSVTFRGPSTCRICGCPNGCRTDSDGVHEWPSGLVHYLVEHGLRPPEEIVRRLLGP